MWSIGKILFWTLRFFSFFLQYQRWPLEKKNWRSATVAVSYPFPIVHPWYSLTSCLLSLSAEAVHHVSVSINVSHSSLVCGEAWGTEPHFSWLYERVAITSAVGTVSKDGTTLYVTKSPFCGQFTCMVSNKMGHSTATYTAGECGLVKENIKGKSARMFARLRSKCPKFAF